VNRCEILLVPLRRVHASLEETLDRHGFAGPGNLPQFLAKRNLGVSRFVGSSFSARTLVVADRRGRQADPPRTAGTVTECQAMAHPGFPPTSLLEMWESGGKIVIDPTDFSLP
jgi:hypothetical protein